MRRLLCSLVVLTGAFSGCGRSRAGSPPAPVKLPGLRTEILRMVEGDQAVQARIAVRMQAGQPVGAADFAQRDSVFRVNLDRMRVILATYGWPGRSLVGDEGSHGAWLLLQHADQDTVLQQTALARLADAVSAGDASSQDLAYLTDRVRVAEGRPQVYGTQLQYDSRGCASAKPSEAPERLDARRAAAGLEPMAAYVRRTMEALGRAGQCSPTRLGPRGAVAPLPNVALKLTRPRFGSSHCALAIMRRPRSLPPGVSATPGSRGTRVSSAYANPRAVDWRRAITHAAFCRSVVLSPGGRMRSLGKWLVRGGLLVWSFGLVAAVSGVWVTMPPIVVEWLVLGLAGTSGGLLVAAGVAVGRGKSIEAVNPPISEGGSMAAHKVGGHVGELPPPSTALRPAVGERERAVDRAP